MKLHKFILTLSLIVILFQITNGQTRADKILDIRKTFQKINNDTSLKKRTIDDAEEFLGHATDGGGELIGYFHKDSICKIFATVGLSYGTISDGYYFRNGQLIFVYEVEKDFPETDNLGGLDFNKLDLVFEGRYYFDKDKIIDKITKGKRRFEDRQDNASSFITDAKGYSRLITTKGR
jgi:hypothetical protein